MLHVLLKIRGMHAAAERAGVAAGTVSITGIGMQHCSLQCEHKRAAQCSEQHSWAPGAVRAPGKMISAHNLHYRLKMPTARRFWQGM